MILNDVHTGIQKRKPRKRVGRGPGSGHGKTSGRGHKGYYSRSGSRRRHGFEGGQMPFFRRVAKRGFNNAAFADRVVIINVGQLDKAFDDGAEITVELLVSRGMVPSRHDALQTVRISRLPDGRFHRHCHRWDSWKNHDDGHDRSSLGRCRL